ncbi:hypothetical protein QE382_003743 [Sphingobacterium zeae]|uniref:Uncharacterized protein n=1 Tax=Sphingobacterium zeae TaxID=1776859 RepID=A0ABU0UAA9_9SPHI|nr:hypothetical protein [Sphingobacterium zeae]
MSIADNDFGNAFLYSPVILRKYLVMNSSFPNTSFFFRFPEKRILTIRKEK